MITESSRATVFGLCPIAASMRPRSDDHGKDEAGNLIGEPSRGFNEAAIR